MRSKGFTLLQIMCLVLVSYKPGEAATNPALAMLSQATVVQFSGREAVSEPFIFDVDVAAADKALNFAMVVGQPLTLSLAPGRVLSGMVDRIEQVDGPGMQGLYRLRLVPSLNRLKYRSTSRTFYGMKAIEIATALLAEAGVTNVETRISASLPAQEIAVQYQETDFAFVSRLLEEAGIHYHFEPSPTGDKVVFSDGNASLSHPSASLSLRRAALLQSPYSAAGNLCIRGWSRPATTIGRPRSLICRPRPRRLCLQS
jgi:uncharacterized protein involved in type VI secretion and phage assembly